MPITIYITGPVGSGKTTIATIVHKALRDAGLEVVDETEPPEAWHVDGRTLDAVRSEPVTLRETATVRPTSSSCSMTPADPEGLRSAFDRLYSEARITVTGGPKYPRSLPRCTDGKPCTNYVACVNAGGCTKEP